MPKSSQLIQPSQSNEILFEEKRSRFISELFPVNDEQAVKNRIKALKNSHPKASHVCSAYRLRKNGKIIEGFSDDGEPSGTAGMPMLKTMRHRNLVNCTVLVTRYFGGTKLGTGGLQRAYSHSASEVISSLDDKFYKTVVDRQPIRLTADFRSEGIIRRLLGDAGATHTEVKYETDGITVFAEVREHDAEEIISELLSRGYDCTTK
ncbi:hypothetical protein A3759_01670 [Thalassolituus sp. HI0120]|nr:hypothetical protein A3759_01670 [Thalassolituus sp. HI0120]